MEEAQEWKRAKYRELVEQCHGNGWRTRCKPVEVGCKGFVGLSLHQALKLLGIQQMNKAHKNISEDDEKAFNWIWKRKER